MDFKILSENNANIVRMTLSGHLNALSAPDFHTEFERSTTPTPRAIVLQLADLEFMSSAGLRIIVFFRQKMGPGVRIFVVAPRADVRETIRLSGFHQALIFLDTYDASVIEA